MRLISVELESFRSHDRLNLSFEQLSCAAITGRNGAGKTSILQALSWALHGGTAGDELISHGAKTMSVAVTFEVAGRRWKVTRVRERERKTTLSVAWPQDGSWQSEPLHTVADAQARVEEILGMNGAIFEATVYSPQGRAGELAQMTAGARKQLIGSLLGLEAWEGWREEASARARAALGRAQGAQEALASLCADADRLEPELGAAEELSEREGRISAELARYEAELDAAIERERAREQHALRDELGRQMVQVVQQGKLRKEREEELAGRRRELIDIEAATEALARAEGALEAERRRIEAWRVHETAMRGREQSTRQAERAATSQKAELEKEGRRLDRQAEDLGRRLSDFTEEDAPRCDRCQQVLQAATRTAAIRSVKAELAGAAKARAELGERLAELEREIRELREAHARAVDAAKVEDPQDRSTELAREVASRRDTLTLAQVTRRTLAELDAQLSSEPSQEALTARWRELRAKRDSLPLTVADGPAPAAVREMIAAAARELSGVERALEELARNERRRAELLASIEHKKSELGALTLRSSALGVLERACSRNGIPALILDGAVQGIEAAANRILSELGAAFTVRLATQVQRKSAKGMSETLEILLDDGMVERPISTFSGGEAMRCHLALRLALGEVLGQKRMDVILIDELTDVDSAGIEAIGALLQQLAARGRQAIVVSHIEALSDSMPERIHVTRRSAASPSEVSVQ